MTAPCLKISGQSIPWWFVQKVRKWLSGEWDATIDCFWKFRDKRDILKYVAAGMIPDEKGICYSRMPSIERENGKMEMIRQWWEVNVHKPKPKKDCMTIKEIFRELAK